MNNKILLFIAKLLIIRHRACSTTQARQMECDDLGEELDSLIAKESGVDIAGKEGEGDV